MKARLFLGYRRKDQAFIESAPITIRLIGFSYGPSPEDWHCWYSNLRDEFASEFWEMVENGDPSVRIPGAWVN